MEKTARDILEDSLNSTDSSTGKTLDERIDETSLEKKEAIKIAADSVLKNSRDTVRDILNGDVGNVIFKLVDIVEDYNKDEREAKAALLLGEYFAQSDSHEDQLNKLKQFLKNVFGKTLYVKIIRLLDDEPLDRDLAQQLSVVLKNFIASENLSKAYAQDKYLLTIIERLSPAALTLLTDHGHWQQLPAQIVGGTTMIGKAVQGDWTQQFAWGYLAAAGQQNSDLQPQIAWAYQELVQSGVCQTTTIGDAIALEMSLTEIGKLLLQLLTY